MRPTPESDKVASDCGRGFATLLDRARSHVLNVLVAVGLGIAVSGWLLRQRALAALPRPSQTLSNALYGVLIALAVISYVSRRMLARRAARAEIGQFDRLFYTAHLIPALIGSIAVPLGLAYGWLIRPQLEAIAPFWATPLVLGFLSLPRRSEWNGRADTSPPRESASQ